MISLANQNEFNDWIWHRSLLGEVRHVRGDDHANGADITRSWKASLRVPDELGNSKALQDSRSW